MSVQAIYNWQIFLHAYKLQAWIINFDIGICHACFGKVFVVSLFGDRVLAIWCIELGFEMSLSSSYTSLMQCRWRVTFAIVIYKIIPRWGLDQLTETWACCRVCASVNVSYWSWDPRTCFLTIYFIPLLLNTLMNFLMGLSTSTFRDLCLPGQRS